VLIIGLIYLFGISIRVNVPRNLKTFRGILTLIQEQTLWWDVIPARKARGERRLSAYKHPTYP
jgi:hypothetical protein